MAERDQQVQGVVVQIFGEEYRIGGDPAQVQQVADYVDRKMQEISQEHSDRLPKAQVAMLAAMEITAEYFRVMQERKAFTTKAHESIDRLTRLVEEAVLMEFDRIAERGGVLGAMETGYQRSKIQEESIYYETMKHTGELPIIGVNTFREPSAEEVDDKSCALELSRATEEEKRSQLNRLREFQQRNENEAPAALERLQKVTQE